MTTILNNTVAIFFLLNSFGTLPLFIAFTKDESFKEKAVSAIKANIVAVILLSAFIWAGKSLMEFFGLTLSSFEIGGGIILFKIAMEMLNCSLKIENYLKQAENLNKTDSSVVVPLGIPLLAGPGSIAVIMTMTVSGSAGADEAGINIALIIASVLSAIVWALGGFVFHKFKGDTIRELITKLGGLFLLILSVQMIINGVTKVEF